MKSGREDDLEELGEENGPARQVASHPRCVVVELLPARDPEEQRESSGDGEREDEVRSQGLHLPLLRRTSLPSLTRDLLNRTSCG